MDRPAVRRARHRDPDPVLHDAHRDGLPGALRENAALSLLALGHARLPDRHARQAERGDRLRRRPVYERAPVLQRALDRPLLPLVRLLREGLGLTPDQVSWASLGVTLAAAYEIAVGRLGAGLILMAAGQLVDAMDGAMARIYQLTSPAGRTIDTIVDRLSETAIFAAFAFAGLVSWTWVLLALVAIMLLTSVSNRSHLDPGAKRFALSFVRWGPYPLLFRIISGSN